MKWIAFLFVILLCSCTKEVVSEQETETYEFDVYYQGEQREKGILSEQNKILLGAFIKQDKMIENMEQFENTVKEHDIYSYCTTLTEEFPMMDILECYANEKIPMLVIQPSDRNNPFDTEHLEEAAQKANQYHIPMLVDFYPNGEDYSNGEEYKQYYKKAREVFRKNAKNTSFIWTMSIENIEKWKSYYPEDVDYIGLSIYENGGNQGKDIAQMLERWYAIFQNEKPLILSHVGISHYSESNSKYTEKEASDEIQRLYQSIPKYPAIKAVVYDSINLTRQGVRAVEGENYSIVENKKVLETYQMQNIKSINEYGTWYKSFWKGCIKDGIIYISKDTIQEIKTDFEDVIFLEGKAYVKNIEGYYAEQKQNSIFLYKQ